MSRSITAFIAVALAVLGALVWGMVNNRVNAESHLSKVAVVLIPAKTTYVVGEPVNFSLRVENRSEKSVELWQDPPNGEAPYYGRIWWRRSGTTEWNLYQSSTGLKGKGKRSNILVSLPAGHYWEYQYNIWYSPSAETGFMFERPGKYEFQAGWAYLPPGGGAEDLGDLKSPITAITVTEPTGNDAIVWRELASRDRADLLYRRLHELPALTTTPTFAALKALLRKYPTFVYADLLTRAVDWPIICPPTRRVIPQKL